MKLDRQEEKEENVSDEVSKAGYTTQSGNISGAIKTIEKQIALAQESGG